MTENVLFILCFSNQLQTGKNIVAKIVPINSGIKKSFAIINPATTKNRSITFFNMELV
jgi:hypothetical protein